MSIGRTFPALEHRNFRYFWFGQCISLLGTWMQTTAQQWLVYTLTKSALLLGLLGAAQFGPVMLLSLFAGVFVDRYPKKKILMLTQAILMLQALALGALVFSGHVAYWHILLLAVITGFANTLDLPTRQSFLPELVDTKEHLRSAIGLNSAIVNVARMIGPALSAVLLARYSAGLLFLLNGISFIPVIYGIYRIDAKPALSGNAKKTVLTDIKEGIKYIYRSPVLLGATLSMFAVGTFVMNFNVVIPLYAAIVLNKGVHEYGLLLSASGAGSLIGALIVAAKARGNPRLGILFGSGLAVSLLLALFYFIHSLGLAMAAFIFVGFCNILFITTVNSTIQLNSSDQFRGRVMSVYSFAFAGTTPIGNLFAGSVTEKFGPGVGFLTCGCVASVLLLLVMGLVTRRNSKDLTSTT